MEPSLTTGIFFGIMQIALFSGALLMLRCWRDIDGVERTLAVALLAFLVVLGGLPVLSLFDAMALWPVAVLMGCWFGLGITVPWVVCRFFAARPPTANSLPLPSPHSLYSPLSPLPLTESKVSRWLAALAVTLASWSAVYFLLRGLIWPVEVVSDAPIYQLYFAARWWQARRIEWVATPFGELAATYFPGNGNLWLTWLLVTLDSPHLAKVGQWPFLVLASFALYGMGRRLGAGPAAALFPPCVWSVTLVAALTSGMAIVDLIFSAWLLVAVFFFQCYHQRLIAADASNNPLRAGPFWCLFALSAGVALGTKSIGVVFLAPLVGAALLFVPRCTPNRALFLCTMAIGLLLPSIYWYGSNTWKTGNPLYPLAINIGGYPLFAGWYDSNTMRRASGYHLNTNQPELLWKLLANHFDPRLFVLWIAAFFWTMVVFLRSRTRGGRCEVALTLLALTWFISHWWIIPYNSQGRFLLAAAGIGLVPLAGLLHRRPLLQLCVLALMAWHLLMPPALLPLLDLPPPPLAGSRTATLACVVLHLFLVAWILARGTRWTWPLATIPLSGAAALILPITVGMLLANPLLRHYPPMGFGANLLPAWWALEQGKPAPGTTIAYAGTNLPYYLMGPRLDYRVVYVNPDHHHDWLPHDYHQERLRRGERQLAPSPWPDWHRAAPDYEGWLASLRHHRVQYLFVARENRHGQLGIQEPTYPLEYYWALRHPEQFQAVSPITGWAVLFRVRGIVQHHP